MAESKARSTRPKRRLRPAQTVREKAQASEEPTDKPNRGRRAVRVATKPVRASGRGIAKVLRPFRFLLWPFKTKPIRFIGRILGAIFLFRFFRGAWQELKLVVWPDRKQTTQLTIAVFVFAIIFGIIIAVTDYGLDKIFKRILVK